MIRWMTWINFFGVLAVAGLCGRQWTDHTHAVRSITTLGVARQTLADKVAEQATLLASQQHDLDTVRGQLITSDADLTAARQKLSASTAERDRLATDNAKQQATLDQWKAAIADRDRTLKEASVQVQTLVAARDDAVRRYNDLVVRFNQQQKPEGK